MAYQNPNFNKKEYWSRRKNMVEVKDEDGKVIKGKDKKPLMEHKPLRGQGDKPQNAYYPSNDITIGFGPNGTLIAMNREARRQKTVLKDYTKPKKVSRKKKNGKKNMANKGNR